MRKSLGLIYVFCGAFVGAGFASGQELYVFFARYGFVGILGLVLAFFLVGYLFFQVIKLCRKHDIACVEDFFYILFPNALGRIYAVLTRFFMFALLAVMLSGGAALISEGFSLSRLCSLLLLSAFLWLSVLFGGSGVVKLQKLLVPPLLLGTILLAGMSCFANLGNGVVLWEGFSRFFTIKESLVSAVLYSSYNFAGALAVILSFPGRLRQAKFSLPVIVTLFLLLPALLLTFALLLNPVAAEGSALPALSLASQLSPICFVLASVLLFLALFTSAQGALLSLISGHWIRRRFRMFFGTIFVLVAALPFAMTDFPVLVENLYTLFALLFMPLWLKLMLWNGR